MLVLVMGNTPAKGGIPTQKIEETKVALRELGLDDDVEVK